MKDILFSVYEIFPPRYFLTRTIFLEISPQDISSEITHTPLKSQMVGPLLHPEVTTVTCYKLQVRMLASS